MVDNPNQVWVADITYIAIAVGFVYMAAILDAWSRRVVGYAANATFWTLPTSFLTGAAAAGGIALINSIGNLGGFVGPYAIGWIKDATGETTLGLVLLAACSIIAGVVTFLMGHDSKIEMAGSRVVVD